MPTREDDTTDAAGGEVLVPEPPARSSRMPGMFSHRRPHRMPMWPLGPDSYHAGRDGAVNSLSGLDPGSTVSQARGHRHGFHGVWCKAGGSRAPVRFILGRKLLPNSGVSSGLQAQKRLPLVQR